MLHTALSCWQPFLGLAVVLIFMGSTIGCPARCECSAQNKSVSCHRRRLLTIPEGIPIETKILDLSKNRLKSINPEEFISYPLLEEIDLSDNIIANVEPGAFNNLFNLRSLRLKGNRLKLVPLGVFTGLSNLTKLIRLQELHIVGAQLRTIEPHSFQGLRFLRVLNVSQNLLETLEENVFSSPRALEVLSINNNPLACDCRLLWILQRHPTLQFGGQQPMCAGPDTIRERSFKDFHSTALSFYFTCKKPRIRDKKLQHLLVDEGQTVQLECNADGDPQPVISWVTPRRRFITTKSNGRATVLGDGTLEIRFAQDQDSGMYVCIASNAAGNDTFTASLTVKGFASDRFLYANRTPMYMTDSNDTISNGTNANTFSLDLKTILVSTAMGCFTFLGVVLFCFLLLFVWSRGKGKHKNSIDLEYVPRKNNGAVVEGEVAGPRRFNMKMI